MKVKTVARFALLMALALVLGFAERWIPVAPGIPGIKLGLANTVLLYAVYMTAPLEAVVLMLGKVLLSGFLFAGFSAMLYSLAGAILSLVLMLLLRKAPRLGVVSVSVCGAVAHNVGQLTVAFLMLGVYTVWAYLPVLILSGVVMGMITGYIAHNVFSALDKSGTKLVVAQKPLKQTLHTDIAVVAIVLVIAGVFWIALTSNGFNLNQSEKNATHSAEPEYYVLVTQNNETKYAIPLTDYGIYTIKNRYSNGENTFVIDQQGVHIESANCPDKICMHQGTIGAHDLIPISCLPNRLVLEIVSRSDLPKNFDWNAQDLSALNKRSLEK